MNNKTLIPILVVVIIVLVGAVAFMLSKGKVIDYPATDEQIKNSGYMPPAPLPNKIPDEDDSTPSSNDDTLPTNEGKPIVIIDCDPNNRPEACYQIFRPVCGLVNVQCITTPCPPLEETFSNDCHACQNQLVESYKYGSCEE